MHRIRLKISYDGLNFSGWQKQNDTSNTVQGIIEEALRILISSELKKQRIDKAPDITLHSASRTDAGVSAREQYITLDLPKTIDLKRLIGGLNGLTPKEITFLEATIQADSFSARFSPHIKQYSYYLSTQRTPYRRCWDVGSILDFPKMIEGAHLILGKHDFKGFRTSDCSAKTTIRTIHLSELTRMDQDIFVYNIRGNGFLKQMVRIIIGYLVQIGRQRLSLDDLKQTLITGVRSQKVETAPAAPLLLEWIDYTINPY